MYHSYADELFRYAFVHVQDEALAQDIVADTFLKAWRHFGSFDHKHPKAWLYTIAKNNMRDQWRKAPMAEIDAEHEDDNDSRNPVVQTEKVLLQERVQRAIAKLPNNLRDVVHCRCIMAYSAKETADVLKITEANVRVLQHRALKKLRALL